MGKDIERRKGTNKKSTYLHLRRWGIKVGLGEDNGNPLEVGNRNEMRSDFILY